MLYLNMLSLCWMTNAVRRVYHSGTCINLKDRAKNTRLKIHPAMLTQGTARLFISQFRAIEFGYDPCCAGILSTLRRPLRSLLCRERKLQLRSLLRKERNIPFRYWFDPGDHALGKVIQLAVCTLNCTLLVLSPFICNITIEIDRNIAYMIYISMLTCKIFQCFYCKLL